MIISDLPSVSNPFVPAGVIRTDTTETEGCACCSLVARPAARRCLPRRPPLLPCAHQMGDLCNAPLRFSQIAHVGMSGSNIPSTHHPALLCAYLTFIGPEQRVCKRLCNRPVALPHNGVAGGIGRRGKRSAIRHLCVESCLQHHRDKRFRCRGHETSPFNGKCLQATRGISFCTYHGPTPDHPAAVEGAPDSGAAERRTSSTAKAIQELSYSCRRDYEQLLDVTGKLKVRQSSVPGHRWESFRGG